MPEVIATIMIVVASLILSAVMIFWAQSLRQQAGAIFDSIKTLFGAGGNSVKQATDATTAADSSGK